MPPFGIERCDNVQTLGRRATQSSNDEDASYNSFPRYAKSYQHNINVCRIVAYSRWT